MSIPKNSLDRARALELAYFLDQYNSGDLGVPHRGEPGYTGPPAGPARMARHRSAGGGPPLAGAGATAVASSPHQVRG